VRARYVASPFWTPERISDDRDLALDDFVSERQRQGAPDYEKHLGGAMAEVATLFEATDDLVSLVSGTALSENPRLVAAARHLVGPPLSEADLDTLAHRSLAGRKRLAMSEASEIGSILAALLDRRRLPWLSRELPIPTPAEREMAVRWTAGLLAVQRTATGRRNEPAARQEAATAACLKAAGYTYVQPPKERTGPKGRLRAIITAIDQLKRGEFTRETVVDQSKCDVPVRLHDGRLLLIECKVSSSALNSLKRLNDVVKKAKGWRASYGSAQCNTSAVLWGVFNVEHLIDAQNDITIFWERDLEPLARFVSAAT
jgi:hypothetical protein